MVVQVPALSWGNAWTMQLLASRNCISGTLSSCLYLNCVATNTLTTGLYIQSLCLPGWFWFGPDIGVRKVWNAKKALFYTAHLISEICVSSPALRFDLCSLSECSLYQRPAAHMNFSICVTPVRLKEPHVCLHFSVLVTTFMNGCVSRTQILISFNGEPADILMKGLCWSIHTQTALKATC